MSDKTDELRTLDLSIDFGTSNARVAFKVGDLVDMLGRSDLFCTLRWY